MRHYEAGRLAASEAACREVLAVEPSQPETLHILAVIAQRVGRYSTALGLVQRAIASQGGVGVFWNTLGTVLHGLGRAEEAAAAYQQSAQLDPASPEPWLNWSNLLLERREYAAAAEACQRAVQLKPDFWQAHRNLGTALSELGQFAAAVGALRAAAAIHPHSAGIRNELGNALTESGCADQAIASYTAALALEPDSPMVRNNLGNALAESGRAEAALAEFRSAVALDPTLPEIHNNIGHALKKMGCLEAAAEAFRKAIEVRPRWPVAYNSLGSLLIDRGELTAGMAECLTALKLDPNLADAHHNVGSALACQYRPDAAIASYRHALRLRPDSAPTYNNLGNALKDTGEFAQAAAAFRRSLELQPDAPEVHSNLIYALPFDPRADAPAIATEQRRWNARFGGRATFPHLNDRDPERRLKIGYVSADLREHAVSYFLLPLLETHDRAAVEVHCYSSGMRSDSFTQRIRQHADAWHDAVGLDDDAMAGRIRADGIDLLVDLSMHSSHNRLPVFARKPAPIQLSWLAYPGSTGVEAIDYRLTDASMEPTGEEGVTPGAERAVRLPDAWCCYRPIGDFPEPGPPPEESAGCISFGSLNNFCKINEPLLRLWARVLEAVPRSRLLILCPEGASGERVRAFFAAEGIDPARLEPLSYGPWPEYVRHWRRIDLALDAFPVNGMTTTCHALWMGVPVISLAGKRPVSRAGLSLLSTAGLPELVAASESDFVQCAKELAMDRERRTLLRATLRKKMQASPLMDERRFATNVERAYRTLWREWCNSQPNPSARVTP